MTNQKVFVNGDGEGLDGGMRELDGEGLDGGRNVLHVNCGSVTRLHLTSVHFSTCKFYTY